MKKTVDPSGALLGLLHFMSQMWDIRRYSIRATDLVLDVGSGQNPHPRADVLLDKFLTLSHERAGGGKLVVDRPLILTDATNTPFPAKSFDFIFCSHLLEHVESPSNLIEELMRIGKRGYLETPSKTYEKLWGWNFHRWYVSVIDGRLVLEKKPSDIFDLDLHAWFGDRMRESVFSRLILLKLRAFKLLVRFYWVKSIDYEVRNLSSLQGVRTPEPVDKSAHHPDLEQQLTEPSPSRNVRARLKRTLSRWVRRQSSRRAEDLLLSLQCPGCRTILTIEDTRFVCRDCQSAFERSGNLFDFSGRSPG